MKPMTKCSPFTPYEGIREDMRGRPHTVNMNKADAPIFVSTVGVKADSLAMQASEAIMQAPSACVEERKKIKKRMSLVCKPSQPHNSPVACTLALLTQADGYMLRVR